MAQSRYNYLGGGGGDLQHGIEAVSAQACLQVQGGEHLGGRGGNHRDPPAHHLGHHLRCLGQGLGTSILSTTQLELGGLWTVKAKITTQMISNND